MNSVGFHPKSCKYSPTCCLDAKLKSLDLLRITGAHILKLPSAFSILIVIKSCSGLVILTPVPLARAQESAILLSLPVAVCRGYNFILVTFGLNTCLTFASVLATTERRSARSRSASIASYKNPCFSCSFRISATACSISNDSLLKPRDSSRKA